MIGNEETAEYRVVRYSELTSVLVAVKYGLDTERKIGLQWEYVLKNQHVIRTVPNSQNAIACAEELSNFFADAAIELDMISWKPNQSIHRLLPLVKP